MAGRKRAASNGSKPVAMPVTLATVKMPDPWTGWVFKARSNFPVGMYQTMVDVTKLALEEEDQPEGYKPTLKEQIDEAQRVAISMDHLKHALGGVILEWNFLDIHGKELPEPMEGGLDMCDGALMGAMMSGLLKAVGEVPQTPSGS